MAGSGSAAGSRAYRGLVVLLLAALLLLSCFAQPALAAGDVTGSVKIFGPGRKLAGLADTVVDTAVDTVDDVVDDAQDAADDVVDDIGL